MTKDNTELVEVTQADRDAAVSWARLHLNWSGHLRQTVKQGGSDKNWLVQALAYHRIAATRHSPTDGLAGDKGGDQCTCQAHPTHCANDCPIHGLEPPFDGVPPDTRPRTYADGVEDAAKVAEGWHIPSDWTTDAWGGAASAKKEVVSRIQALKDKSV